MQQPQYKKTNSAGFTMIQLLGLILIAVALAIFAGIPQLEKITDQPEPTHPVIITSGTAADAVTQLNNADRLLQECPGLVTHGADISEIRTSLGAASLQAQKEKQWRTAVKATAIVSDIVSSAPQRSAGYHCHYEMGTTPEGEYGIYWAKPVCAELCGFQHSDRYGYHLVTPGIASQSTAR